MGIYTRLYPPIIRYSVLLWAWMLLLSCTKEKKQIYRTQLFNKSVGTSLFQYGKRPQVYIDLTHTRPSPPAKLSQLLELVKWIPLSGETPIGAVEKVIVLDGRILVFDQLVSNTATLFDSTGAYLTTLSKPGEGPGEYLRLADVQFNPFSKTIDTWDEGGRKLLQFTQEGVFLQEKVLDIFASHFAPMDSTVYVFYKGSNLNDPELDARFITVDINQKRILSKDFPIGRRQVAVPFEPNAILRFNALGQGYFFNENHDNTIYRFTPHHIIPRIFVDFGRRALDARTLRNKQIDAPAYLNLITAPGVYSSIRRPIETAHTILFQFANGKKIMTCVYDKVHNQSRIYERFQDDLFGDALFFPPLEADTAGNFIFVLDPLMIREVLHMKAAQSGIPEAKLVEALRHTAPVAHEILSNTTTQSNLLLIYARIKPNR